MARRIDPIVWFARCDSQVDLIARHHRGLTWQEIGQQRGEVLRLRAAIAKNRRK
ncbi:MAG: hypothetical protein ACOY7T_12295 [Pseudomonadota bacterium]